MRPALFALPLIAAGLFAGTAKADPLTMGQLMTRCARLDLSDNLIKIRPGSLGEALDAGKCWGHLEAYLDFATIDLPDADKPNVTRRPLGSCPPLNTFSFTQLAAMFLDYAHSHPAEHRKPAALVVATLLAQKFPCRK
jgi:hypothetical protein